MIQRLHANCQSCLARPYRAAISRRRRKVRDGRGHKTGVLLMIRFQHLIVCLTSLAVCSAQKLQGENVCTIATFLPFQDLRQGAPDAHADDDKKYGYGTWPNSESLVKASFSLMAAFEMARVHFNERNSVLVPELDQLNDCDIQLADPLTPDGGSWILDSGYNRRLAVDTFLQRTAKEPVCAMIGPVDDHVAQGLSSVAEALDIPLIGFSTISYRLSV